MYTNYLKELFRNSDNVNIRLDKNLKMCVIYKGFGIYVNYSINESLKLIMTKLKNELLKLTENLLDIIHNGWEIFIKDKIIQIYELYCTNITYQMSVNNDLVDIIT